MTSDDVLIKVAEVDHRTTRNTQRIDRLEQQTDALNSLASSVEVMANEQKHQTEAILDIKTNVTALSGKVETLERKPGKRWESIVEKAIFTVVAAVIGFILAKIGL
jgi:hypothetical protein